MNKGKSRKGFTLVELLAVIVVLAIILVIATVSVNNVVKKTRTEAYIKSAQIIRNEIEAICTMDEELTEDAIKDAIDFPGIRIAICKDASNVYISGPDEDSEFLENKLDMVYLENELNGTNFSLWNGQNNDEAIYKVKFTASCNASEWVDTSEEPNVMCECSDWDQLEQCEED